MKTKYKKVNFFIELKNKFENITKISDRLRSQVSVFLASNGSRTLEAESRDS